MLKKINLNSNKANLGKWKNNKSKIKNIRIIKINWFEIIRKLKIKYRIIVIKVIKNKFIGITKWTKTKNSINKEKNLIDWEINIIY